MSIERKQKPFGFGHIILRVAEGAVLGAGIITVSAVMAAFYAPAIDLSIMDIMRQVPVGEMIGLSGGAVGGGIVGGIEVRRQKRIV